MEKMEQVPEGREQIEEKLRTAKAELAELERSINRPDVDFGTSPDDESQTAAADDSRLAILRMRIEDKRREIAVLEERLENAA